MSAYRLLGDAFSEYFLDRVLFEDPKLAPSFRVDDDEIRAAQRLLRDARRALANRANASSTRSQLLEPLAELFGWLVPQSEDLVETPHGEEDGGLALAAPDGGIWARAFCAAPAADLDATPGGRHRRFALVSVISRVLDATSTPYALALNRQELRILRRAESGAPSAIAFDLAVLAESGEVARAGWRLLFGLVRPAALDEPRLLDTVVERGRGEMVAVGERLGRQVQAAAQIFARGLYALEANHAKLPGPADEHGLAALYGETLRVLYRCLFALFAEARGLLPLELPLYRDAYALSTAREAPQQGIAARLRALFVLLRRGIDLGGGERVAAFGGSLFAAEAAPLVESLEWNDAVVAAVLAQLTHVETKRGRIRVSYRELDEERLGSIYEGLLELRLSLADRPVRRVAVKGRELVIDPESLHGLAGYDGGAATGPLAVQTLETIAPGTPYLANSSGRKETASYYTARELVDFLVRETIDPLAERAEPAAILALRVVDPAMGSGHFLIGAMRRLGDHLVAAYRRAGEREGLESLPDVIQASWDDERELVRRCRQLVAVQCLYGVDKNPLAADLARVALWLATAAADHPLSFLDHRLVHGDSLLGLAPPRIIALEPAKKRESKRKPATNGKAASKPTGAAQYAILQTSDGLVDEIALDHAVQRQLERAFAVLRGFLAVVDDEREPFEKKRERAGAVRASLAPLTLLHAARVGELLRGDAQAPPETVAALQAYAKLGYVPEPERMALEPLTSLADAEGAFCWQLAFPDAYYRAKEDGTVVERDDAGFDVVLGNPPWDKLKIDKRSFYARYDPLIADYQGSGADARVAVVDRSLPYADFAFRAARTRMEAYVDTLAQRMGYAWQAVSVENRRTGGDPDTFKYFTERDWQLAAPHGVVGVITPAAFTSGDGTTGLRRLVIDHAKLRSLFVFENRNKIFPIHSSFKFQVLVFERGAETRSFEAAFWLHETDLLRQTRSRRLSRTLSMSASDLRRSSPERLALLEVRTERDLQVAQRIARCGRPFCEVLATYGATLGRELDMTQDRRLFRTGAQIQGTGGIRDGDIYRIGADIYLPLREGRMVQAFDLNAKRYVRGEGRSAEWAENGWPKAPLEPHYWVSSETTRNKWNLSNSKLYWCIITGATNERTAMAAIADPPSISGHSLATVALTRLAPPITAVLLVAFNSFVLDWYFRLSVALNLTFNFVEPAPFVERLELPNVEAHVANLSSADIGYVLRADLRAELDAAVALAYGLSYADFAHVLSGFPLIDRAEPRLEGELRSTLTRDLALAAYCRLAAEHDPEHADRVRAARAIGGLGYVAEPLRKLLPHAVRSRKVAEPNDLIIDEVDTDGSDDTPLETE